MNTENKNVLSALYLLVALTIINVIEKWYTSETTKDEMFHKIHLFKALRQEFATIREMLGDSYDGKVVYQLYGLKASKNIVDAWEAVPLCLKPIVVANTWMLRVWATDLCQRIVPEAQKNVDW